MKTTIRQLSDWFLYKDVDRKQGLEQVAAREPSVFFCLLTWNACGRNGSRKTGNACNKCRPNIFSD